MRISDWSSDVCSSDLGDVLQKDNFIIAAHLLECPAEMMSGFFAISLAIFFPGTSDTLGCVEQPFAGGIVSRPANESADCLLHIFGHMHFRRRFDDIAVFTLVRISH